MARSASMMRTMIEPDRKPRWGRFFLRALLIVLLAMLVLGWISTDYFRSFGGKPDSLSLARMRASPRFQGDKFANAEATTVMSGGSGWGATKEWLFGDQLREPNCPLPLATDTVSVLAKPAASGLRATWLGHSTALIELDGAAILTDPHWSERASPSRWVGPKRFHPPPLPLSALPHLDAVVISHDHFDHLDMETIRALATRGVPFHVALGVGAHLLAWGVPPAQIFEHDWWESSELPNGIRLVPTPGRHFSGRGLPWRTGTLWTSWSILGPKHRAFFSGDTGPTEVLREIGSREGPFDIALIEIGQHHPSWGNIHLGPVGALDAFAMLNAKALLPIHWATFNLAIHAWSEPPETLVTEADKRGIAILTPLLGEPIEPTTNPATTRWWRALPPIAARCP